MENLLKCCKLNYYTNTIVELKKNSTGDEKIINEIFGL